MRDLRRASVLGNLANYTAVTSVLPSDLALWIKAVDHLPRDWHSQAVQAAGQGVTVLHKGRFNKTGRGLDGT